MTYFFVALSGFCFGVSAVSNDSNTDKAIAYLIIGILAAIGAMIMQAVAITYGLDS